MDRKVAMTVRYHLYREETMRFAKEAGFKYICMGLGETDVFTYDDWEKRIGALGEELAKYGLRAVDTHLPVYGLLESSDKRSEVTERSMLRCLKAAKMLGADVCAYHPRTCYPTGNWEDGEDYERSHKDNVEALKRLAEEAEKQNVTVGVENMPPLIVGGRSVFYSCFPEQLNAMVDALGSKHVCALWDTGHAHLMPYDHAGAIKTVGSRIRATHIHESGGEFDAHNVPSVGTLDWEKVLTAFADIGYDGYLTLEASYRHGALSDLYVRYLYETVCRLDDILTRIKKEKQTGNGN